MTNPEHEGESHLERALDHILNRKDTTASHEGEASMTNADKIGLCASHEACYRWPGNTDHDRALRAAYVDGAIAAVSANQHEGDAPVPSTLAADAAIKRLEAAYELYFKRAGVDDGDIITLCALESALRSVCELLAASESRRGEPSPVPEGWQLVPKEPTSSMEAAALDVWLNYELPEGTEWCDELSNAIYSAMLAAAPPASAAEQEAK